MGAGKGKLSGPNAPPGIRPVPSARMPDQLSLSATFMSLTW